MFNKLLGLNKNVQTVTTKTVELIVAEPAKTLKASVHNGNITVSQWEQNVAKADVTVTVLDDQEVTDTDRFWKFDQGGSTIRFEQIHENKWIDSPQVRIDVVLHVPQHLDCRWETHNGNFETAGFQGDILGSAHNGNVTVSNLAGDFEVIVHNGNIDASAIQGHAEAETHNGSLRLAEVAGPVKAVTHNGKIKLEDCSDRLQVESHNGDVTVSAKQAPAGDWAFSTHRGTVDVTIPRDTAAAVKLSSHSGRISGTALPVQVSGRIEELTVTLGNASKEIAIETHSGNINVDFSRER